MRRSRYLTTLTLVLASFLLFAVVSHYSGRVENTPSKARTVLLWVKLYGEEPDVFAKCPELRCAVSYNQSKLAFADAVVFPENAIDLAKMPARPATESQKFIYYTPESLSSLMPGRYLERYPKNFFHMVLSYISGSHVYVPYGGFGLMTPPYSASRVLEPLTEESVFKDKSVEGVFWLVSNCNVASARQYAAYALEAHITVDIAGRCAKNESLQNICPPGDSCEQVFKRYYFYLATENSQCTDYISEKFWTRLHLPLIPIVLQRSLYEKHAPRNSFIAIDDYETPVDLADHLMYLVANRTAYMEYFAWRNASPLLVWATDGFTTVFCNLCRALSASDDRRRVPVIPNIADWFTKRTQCDYETFDVTVWALKARSQ